MGFETTREFGRHAAAVPDEAVATARHTPPENEVVEHVREVPIRLPFHGRESIAGSARTAHGTPGRRIYTPPVHWADILLVRLPLAMWVGGTALAAASAPLIFALIPSREIAGDVFGGILGRLGAIEHGLSLLIVLGVFQAVSREGRIAGVTATGSFLAIACNVYTSMVLRPRLRYYRAQAGSFDVVPEDNPWRSRFRSVHRRSTAVTMIGLVFAAAALAFAP